MKLTSLSSSRALARKSVSVLVAKCDVTTALVRQNDVTFIRWFRTQNLQPHFAFSHFRNDITAIGIVGRHDAMVAHPYGLRKCKRPTSETYRYTQLLKGDKIGKIPMYSV